MKNVCYDTAYQRLHMLSKIITKSKIIFDLISKCNLESIMHEKVKEKD